MGWKSPRKAYPRREPREISFSYISRRSRRGYAFLGDFHPMTDLEAAVGLAQLGRWDEATRVRRRAPPS